MLMSAINIAAEVSEFGFWAWFVVEASLTAVAIVMGLAMAVHAYRHLVSQTDDLRAVFH